jgi:RNA polymerase sigma factor (sigma-70 family)
VVELDEIAKRVQRADPDQAAIRELADTLGPMLFGLYLARGLSPTDAEDLAVSVVNDIILKIDQFQPRGQGSFFRWASTVALNALRDLFRQHGPVSTSELEDVPAREVPTGEEPFELIQTVREAIDQLNEPDRAIVTARLDEPDLTFDAVGRQVGLSGGAARVRYFRALAKLAEHLKGNTTVQTWRNSLRLPATTGETHD